MDLLSVVAGIGPFVRLVLASGSVTRTATESVGCQDEGAMGSELSK
jgi:hypothetical protein